ncbi:hypothetical protein TNCV_1320241 [Trichonephila clavipes]|nr:hypothetical protein TNCV_1320241 [Trichonephila clavipes]
MSQLINCSDCRMVTSQSLGNHEPDTFSIGERPGVNVQVRATVEYFPYQGKSVQYQFVVGYTIEDAPVCDVASRVAAVKVSELRVHTVANVVELFVKTFVVLQTTPVLDSVLVTWLHDPLRPCG